MKSRIPGMPSNDEKRKKKKELITIVEDELMSAISKEADKCNLTIDEYMSKMYSSIFCNSEELQFSPEFKKFIREKVSQANNHTLKLRELLEKGKKAYEERLKIESEESRKKAIFLSRAKFPLDFYIETSLAQYGHSSIPKLASIDDGIRLNKIRETLITIEYSRNCSEEQAINIALNQRLLPDETEILQARLNYINRYNTISDDGR